MLYSPRLLERQQLVSTRHLQGQHTPTPHPWQPTKRLGRQKAQMELAQAEAALTGEAAGKVGWNQPRRGRCKSQFCLAHT